uniref:Uncharacterized protein n=1 Tax=Arundo donax TaxID=35708 RepID=A0A0A9CE07_ARUDO
MWHCFSSCSWHLLPQRQRGQSWIMGSLVNISFWCLQMWAESNIGSPISLWNWGQLCSLEKPCLSS